MTNGAAPWDCHPNRAAHPRKKAGKIRRISPGAPAFHLPGRMWATTRTRRGTTGSAEKAKVTGGLTPAEIQAAVAAEVAPVVGASEAQTAAASATSASATPAVAGSGTPRQ